VLRLVCKHSSDFHLLFFVLALSTMADNAPRAYFSIINYDIKDLREDDVIMELYEPWLAQHKKA
jgi:hypothetical protein